MQHSKEFEALVDEARTRVREISIDAVQGKSGVRLIDVREDGEWAAGRAAGAEHLGKGVIERDVEKACPDHDEELVLYCGGGFRSALAGEALQRMGYRKVLSMAGGWKAWLARGYPTEK